MRKIGYARVSSPQQNLDRQVGALRAERCDSIYREKASGKDVKNRPQLEKAIDELGKGDILIVADWDRATRSMLDGVNIIERIHARGALLKVLDKPRGARFGRKPKLNPHQQAEARSRLLGGESARAIARSYAVHHATVSRLRAG